MYKYFKRRSSENYKFLFASSFAILFLVIEKLGGSPQKPTITDNIAYYSISQGMPIDTVEAPFSDRFLLPKIISHTDNIEFWFHFVNIMSLLIFGILLFSLFERITNRKPIQYAGVAIILLSPVLFRYSIFYNYMLDAPTYVFLVAGIIAAIDDKKTILLMSIIIGVFIRPIVLTALVFYTFIHFSWPPSKEYILTSFFGVIGFLFSMLIIKAVAGESNYYDVLLIKNTITTKIEQFPIATLYYVGAPFKLAWLYTGYLSINWNDISEKWVKRGLLVIPIVFLQLLVASGWNRILFQLFFIIVPASVFLFVSSNIEIPRSLLIAPYIAFVFGILSVLFSFYMDITLVFKYHFILATLQTVPYMYLSYTYR